MLKKLQDKKGFTLVELMIVVVIMGILVAVAIPIYNSATKNAKMKSCDANVRVIEENLNSYLMTGGANGAPMTVAEVNSQFGADISSAAANKTKLPDNFVAMFKGKAMPTCPFDSAASYEIQFEKLTDGIGFTVYCTSAYTKADGTKNTSGEHGKALPAA